MTAGEERGIPGRVFGLGSKGGRNAQARVRGADLLVLGGDGERALPLGGARLSLGGTDDAMLVLEWEDGAEVVSLYLPVEQALAALRAAGHGDRVEPLDRERARRRGRGRLVLLGAGLAAVVLAVLLVQGTGWLVSWGLARVPPQWEVSLGQSLMERMHPEAERLEDPALTTPVEQVFGRLLEALGPETPYRFEVHLIRNGQVNAFALPGGQLAVYTGLLARTGSPEELAGVLGHEIQHVLGRHSLRQIAGHLKWSILLALVVGNLESLHGLIIGHAADLMLLSYGRDAEREADRGGLELLYRAHIDPNGMPRFFDELGREQGGAAEALSFVSTHPGSLERARDLRRRIARRGPGEPRPFSLDWEAVRTAAREASR